ncbi:hypothetical protein AAG906_014791 [Vitis piasezkii]
MTFGHNSWRCILPNGKNFPTSEVRQIYQKSQKMDMKNVRREILHKDPLPDLEECYALIRREAIHHASMKAESDNPDTSTMVVQQQSTQNWQDQSKTNHPKTNPNIDNRCFEIVGYRWWDHNHDQRKKDSKKTSIATIAK